MSKMVEDRFSLIRVLANISHFSPNVNRHGEAGMLFFPLLSFLTFFEKATLMRSPSLHVDLVWFLTWPLMHIIEKQCLKCRRNQLIKLCLFKTHLYRFIDIHRYMCTGTLDTHRCIYTGTKSENPFTIHSSHCCSMQEARLSPSRQFLYVPIKDGYTVHHLSTSIARKSEIVGHQSQRDFFHEQAGPELNTALHQLKESAFLLPEFTLCSTTSDKERESAHI